MTLLTSIDERFSFTPALRGEWDGAARLTHALCLTGHDDHGEPSAELRSAAREFAIEWRNDRRPPEQLVLAIKHVFEELDHHTPSLAEMEEDGGPQTPAYAQWYPRLLSLCIATYFEAA